MREAKVYLPKSEMPTAWYNVLPDLPGGLPAALNPSTGKPVGPQDLEPIFPMEIIMQEVSSERYISIPEEVLDIYGLWRPTPLHRAFRLEQYLNTSAKIYYKYEGTSPAGSHKPNTAIAQAYYNKKAGVKRLTTETGAGQWGSALALASQLFGIDCRVYMVRLSYDQKPYRRSMMQTWGAEVIPSPSDLTKFGRSVLEKTPNNPGSLGIAIGEAVEDAVGSKDAKYSLGSVLNHVMMHQTVIGLEATKQMDIAGDYPDVVIGCFGGGSNFCGLALPFLRDKLAGKEVRLVAVEPSACPTLTKGVYAYDFGDTGKMTPILKMYTLGHDFIPPEIHSGGLRYHGASPIASRLLDLGLIEAISYDQVDTFEAAVTFAKTEGIVPAPESSHAIKAAIEEAKACEGGETKTILFNLSGHGHFDMAAYDQYLGGKLVNCKYQEDIAEKSLASLPRI